MLEAIRKRSASILVKLLFGLTVQVLVWMTVTASLGDVEIGETGYLPFHSRYFSSAGA